MSKTEATNSLAAIDHLDIWTGAWLKKAGTGRGKNGKLTPYGIQKLRELILELAVRGRLVPQGPNDEPASVLLEKIAEEKARLVKEGKIKKQKKLPEINEEEKPFDLPKGWEWVRVREICHDWGQKKPNKEFTYIDVSAIDNNLGLVDNPVILSADVAPSRARKIVHKGTVIYSTVRPYLKNIAIIDEEFDPEPIASTAFAIVHPFSGIPGSFLVSVFRSPLFVRYVESVQTGIAYPAINDKQFFAAVVPLPPLAEQHRIVAKVEELMALCDRLEQEQTDSLEAHQTLVETLLRTLVEAPDAKAAQQAWTRIAQHFDTLFITEHNIDQLKQTILQLAVMGKLVPQNPNDEPASVLLKKIAEEKARLVKEGKIKKQKKLPEITEDEKPFNLPKGWYWSRLGSIGFTQTGSTPKKANAHHYGKFVPFLKPADISDGEIISYANDGLSEEGVKSLGRIAPADSVLMVCIGTIGKCARVSRKVSFNQQINSVTPYVPIGKYVSLYLRSKVFQERAWAESSSTTIAILNKGKWERIPIAIPPFAEQHRIVAKVDELMALCDALKARVQQAETIRLRLADAVVEQAVGQ